MSTLEATFARLYDANRGDIYYYILKSIRDEDTALDILQDSYTNFFRIFQERPLPPDDIQCRMYLFRIARNLMINFGKSGHRSRVDLVENYENVEYRQQGRSTSDPEAEAIDRMEAEAREDLLRSMMAAMPEDQRTALLLRYDSDMKLEEIAEVLNVSISTASRLLQKARDALIRADQERHKKN